MGLLRDSSLRKRLQFELPPFPLAALMECTIACPPVLLEPKYSSPVELKMGFVSTFWLTAGVGSTHNWVATVLVGSGITLVETKPSVEVPLMVLVGSLAEP